MPSALDTRSVEDRAELFYVHHRSDTGQARAFHELARVQVKADVTTIEGDVVGAGTVGTVVSVWKSGDFYDVDFADARGPATVSAELLNTV